MAGPQYSDLPPGAEVVEYSDLPPGAEVVPPSLPAKAAPPSPTSSVSVPPSGAGQWLRDLESDFRYGGGLTAVGRLMQKMGSNPAGVTPLGGQGGSAGEYITSPLLGATQMAQGIAEKSPLRVAKGALTASQIPSSFIAPEVSNAVPNITRASDAFANLAKIGPQSVVNHLPPAQTAAEIKAVSQSGAQLPKVIRNFLSRISTADTNPLTYTEAQRFISNASRMSVNEYNNLTPNVQRLVGEFASNLRGSIQANRDALGVGDQYAGAVKEYARASRLNEIIGQIQKYAATTAAGAAGVEGYLKLKGMLSKR